MIGGGPEELGRLESDGAGRARKSAETLAMSGVRGLPPELFALVYDELRALAGNYLTSERVGHTLQPTALVHEAWVRLELGPRQRWTREHLKACAALVMRHVLVDHARAKAGPMRGGHVTHVPLSVVSGVLAESPAVIDLIELTDALERLAEMYPRQTRVAELRLFGDLSHEETAATLDVSLSTVEADWRFARAWIRRELGDGSGSPGP